MKKRLVALLSLAASVAMMAAAANAEVSDETITVAYNTELASFDFNNLSNSGSNDYFGAYVDARLVMYDFETGEAQPWLAESWELQDDNMTYRFHLRDNVVSHNGFALTAQDVIDSYQRAADCKPNGKYTKYLDMEKCAVVDDLTVDIVTTEPFADTLAILTLSPFVIKSTAGIEAEGGYEAEAMNPQAGFGPYKFVEWVTGDHVTFERDDNFWGELPYYKTAIARIIPDDSARLMNLQSGDIQAMNRILPSQAQTAEDDTNIQVERKDNVNQMYQLILNNSSEPLKDARVRRALSMALNREGALVSVFDGAGTVADGWFGSSVSVYAEPDASAENYYQYDPEAAKALLEEAGYGDGFELTLICMEQQLYTSLAEFANMQWSEFGVTVNIEISDSPTFFEKMNSGSYDVVSIATSGNMYSSQGQIDPRLSIAEGGSCAFVDGGEEYEAAFAAASQNMYGTEENKEALAKVQDIIREYVPSVSVVNGQVIYGVKTGLTGVMMFSMGDPSFVFLHPEE